MDGSRCASGHSTHSVSREELCGCVVVQTFTPRRKDHVISICSPQHRARPTSWQVAVNNVLKELPVYLL